LIEANTVPRLLATFWLQKKNRKETSDSLACLNVLQQLLKPWVARKRSEDWLDGDNPSWGAQPKSEQ
jgi:hypothetical protein